MRHPGQGGAGIGVTSDMQRVEGFDHIQVGGQRYEWNEAKGQYWSVNGNPRVLQRVDAAVVYLNGEPIAVGDPVSAGFLLRNLSDSAFAGRTPEQQVDYLEEMQARLCIERPIAGRLEVCCGDSRTEAQVDTGLPEESSAELAMDDAVNKPISDRAPVKPGRDRGDAMNQKQMFYRAQKRSAEADQLFLDMVSDGLTREELETNIKRRPELWGRWEGWLEKLPSGAQAKAETAMPDAPGEGGEDAPGERDPGPV